MTNSAYQVLYQSSVTFAMRKQLQAEHGKEALQKEIKGLEDERMTNLNQVWQLKERIQSLKTRHAERRAVDKEKRAEEIKFLEF